MKIKIVIGLSILIILWTLCIMIMIQDSKANCDNCKIEFINIYPYGGEQRFNVSVSELHESLIDGKCLVTKTRTGGYELNGR